MSEEYVHESPVLDAWVSMWSLYDKVTETFGPAIEFNNDDLAFASVRRQTRDTYDAGDITFDALHDQIFVKVAEFNMRTGEFKNLTNDRKHIECWRLVDQL